MELVDKLKEYSALLDEKKELEDKQKALNKEINDMKNKLSDMMLEDDCQKISAGGYTFSCVVKTKYSRKSAEALAESGVDLLDTLRREGMGDIIQETVSPMTFQAAMKSYVDTNGELSPGLASITNTYDYMDIMRRKDRTGR